MTRCPKCKTENPPRAKECDGCGLVFADAPAPVSPTACACGKPGMIKREHGWKCWDCSDSSLFRRPGAQARNYRERWYSDNRLPYEPPNLEPCLFFRCVGVLHGPVARMREPGED